MSRHLSTETFQMDLRSSPSQQNLEPSRSSSVASQPDEMEARNSGQNDKSHKLDLYSIPVFLLEVLVLIGLAYLAHYIHFQYHYKPLISGFYCDDISYRQQFVETKLTKSFSQEENELTVVALILAVPIVLIIFCELVNSMFGSLKFRQIRALCTCCKLHSITRRSIRFTGAYALGLFIVMISCDILATIAGRLRPYFAKECPNAYQPCLELQAQGRISGALSNSTTGNGLQIAERQWIDLSGQNLANICNFGDETTTHKLNQIAMSWPSFPAALVIYACIYVSCYLCFVGTARPFRIITCVLVTALALVATVFGVQLVKDHYNHWDDVVASAVLAFSGVIFVLYVYLNKFKDTHYYENQKLAGFGNNKYSSYPQDGYTNYSGEGLAGQYNLDKSNVFAGNNTNGALQNGETGGSLSNNDLAMRYFQIPRANYRGAPRPLSSLNQMRS